jgi:hypothetical protein
MITYKRTVANLLLFASSLAFIGSCASSRQATSSAALPYHAVDHIEEHPARLIGEDASLTIDHGVLGGRLDGGQYDVRITPDAAKGSGPMGPIDVQIKRVASAYDVSGLWNGGHLHFRVSESGAEGNVLKQISADDRGYQSCHYEIERLRSTSGYTGLSECLGAAEPLRFEIRPRRAADMTDEQNVILLVAYFAAPPAVRSF